MTHTEVTYEVRCVHGVGYGTAVDIDGARGVIAKRAGEREDCGPFRILRIETTTTTTEEVVS